MMAEQADEGMAPNGDYPSPREEGAADDTGEVIGSTEMRPIFLGNLTNNYKPEQVTDIFERPAQPKPDSPYEPMAVDRIDQKRGYCFVFLKDAPTQADKERAERFVSDINGMEIPDVSKSLRSEFARGDGRIKRKEDERRKNIAPSETLFVVNFHEESTRREDLEMLFSPFGELVRIDMRRNYAFVQFRTIEEATKAKEKTNGGKLDQSVLTVEYVARQRGGGGGRERDRRRDRRGDRDDRRTGRDSRGGRYDDRYDSRRGGSYDRRYDEGRHRRDSPPPYARRDSPPPYPRRRTRSWSRSPERGGRRGRSRSRSLSPSRYGYRSRSPPRGRYDDRDRGYRG